MDASTPVSARVRATVQALAAISRARSRDRDRVVQATAQLHTLRIRLADQLPNFVREVVQPLENLVKPRPGIVFNNEPVFSAQLPNVLESVAVVYQAACEMNVALARLDAKNRHHIQSEAIAAVGVYVPDTENRVLLESGPSVLARTTALITAQRGAQTDLIQECPQLRQLRHALHEADALLTRLETRLAQTSNAAYQARDAML